MMIYCGLEVTDCEMSIKFYGDVRTASETFFRIFFLHYLVPRLDYGYSMNMPLFMIID